MLTVILVILAAGLAYLWLQIRDQRLLIALGIVGGLLVALLIYDWLRPETVAEAMERKVKAMAQAINDRDVDGIFQHVSERFRTNRYNYASMRAQAERSLSRGDVTAVEVWNFAEAKVQDETASLEFSVKVRGSQGEGLFKCTAMFVKDPDGEWRLSDFRLYSPLGKGEVPLEPY